jgi:tetratricopeptide (TPR) repeat protein
MNSPRTFFLLLIALLIFCFGLGADLQPRLQSLENRRGQSDNFFSLLLGDSSRIFANNFYVKADAYYHSGFYPTIFDNNEAFKTPHLAEDTGAVASRNQGEETDFLGEPRDWIDAFGRHFIPNRHTHLDAGGPTDDLSNSSDVREILPWLKLSAELDPDNVQTYTVTAYWLRRMGKIAEAEQVLHEGLRYNPGSYDILFELGRLFNESDHDTVRARNVWEAALRIWRAQGDADKKDSQRVGNDILVNLAQLEENAGNYERAIQYWKEAKQLSPNPDAIQKQIDEARKNLAAPADVPAVQPH